MGIFRQQKIYWTDVTRGRIESMNFDGTGKEILHNREIPNGEGIAVEWITKKLYWVRKCNTYVSEVPECRL